MTGGWLVLVALAFGRDVQIPVEAKVEARIRVGERWGFWEKSLVVRVPEPTRVFSSNEGFVEAQLVVNHAAHPSLWTKAFAELGDATAHGGAVYMAQVEQNLAKAHGLTLSEVAITGTAADMDNLAVVTERYDPFVVTALVTAGARSNAHRAGTDEGKNIESAGTVNVILLINAQLTDGAQANAVVLATEAKTAAFQDLRVPSTYTPTAQATGTGTDTVIVVPSNAGPEVTYAGGHAKVGELIAKATHQGVMEALARQNGFTGAPRERRVKPGSP